MHHEIWKNVNKMINDIYNSEKNKTTDNPNVNRYGTGNKREYWHYTSLSAVLKIFDEYKDGKSRPIDSFDLYASHIRFMNDKREFVDGKDSLIENNKASTRKKEIKTNIPSILQAYLISFSDEGDSLTQWKWYGRNSGVSFCVKADEAVYSTYSIYNDETDKKGQSRYDGLTRPIDLKYTNPEKQEYHSRLVDNILSDGKRPMRKEYEQLLAPLFIPFCKDAGFSEERESRLVFYTCDDLEQYNAQAKFNYVYNDSDPSNVKPALKVKFRTVKSIPQNCATEIVDESEALTPSENLVTRMIVGPGNNQELVFNCLMHLFDTSRFDYFVLGDRATDEKLEEYSDLDEIPSDGKVHFLKCKNGNGDNNWKKSYAYRCENGLLIQTSVIPFRA